MSKEGRLDSLSANGKQRLCEINCSRELRKNFKNNKEWVKKLVDGGKGRSKQMFSYVIWWFLGQYKTRKAKKTHRDAEKSKEKKSLNKKKA